MTEAGWPAGKDVKEIGWYWWRLHPHRMKVVEVVQDYEGGPLRSYVNGMWIYLEQSGAEWLGPLSPDDKAQGRVACLGDVKRYVERQIKIGEDFIGGPDPNIQRRVALDEVIEYCDRQLAQAQDDQSMKGEQ